MKAVRGAGRATVLLLKKTARDVEHRIDVEVALTFPEIMKGDVPGVPEQPGGLVVEGFGPFFQRPDAQGHPKPRAVAAKSGTGWGLGHREKG